MIAVVLGMLAVVGIHRYIAGQLAAQRRALTEERERLLALYPEPVQVVVASKDLPAGTTLEMAHITPGEVPEKFLQPYAGRSPQDVIGKVTLAPLAAGEQVLLNKLRRPEELPEGSTLSTIVPKGKRAVTIVVDTVTGVNRMVRPGDIVDVVWTIQIPAPDQTQQPQVLTMTLFQDVPVVAVGRQLPGNQPPSAPAPAGEEGAPAPPTPELEEDAAIKEYTVTLALAPQEVSFLLFAREQGRVQLSLRPRNEKGSQADLTPVNMNTLLGAVLGADAMQAPPAPMRRAIELYKGLTRDVIVIEEQPAAAKPSVAVEGTE